MCDSKPVAHAAPVVPAVPGANAGSALGQAWYVVSPTVIPEARRDRDHSAVLIRRACAVWITLVASCYSPRIPEGVACDSTQQCPTPQRCVLGRCTTEAPPIDAPIPIDAAEPIDAVIVIDAAPDAAVLPCTVDGLVNCGVATLFTCGGHCWARCSNSAPRDRASEVCAGWLGALGQIDDAAEQACVGMRVASDTWIGLVQDEAATQPPDGWLWNTSASPVGFTNWQPNRPDDRDFTENGAEQCGMIQGDELWDDVSCGEPHPFFCER